MNLPLDALCILFILEPNCVTCRAPAHMHEVGSQGQAPQSFNMDEYKNTTFKFSSKCLLRIIDSFRNSYWQESGFSFFFKKCRHSKFSNSTNQDYSQISYYFCSIHNCFLKRIFLKLHLENLSTVAENMNIWVTR